jgi:hypothetical protein
MSAFEGKNVLKTSRASDVSLEELLAFERLLFDLSARFANVAGEQVVAEIKIALKQLIDFLGFDRSSFAEFTDEMYCGCRRRGASSTWSSTSALELVC